MFHRHETTGSASDDRSNDAPAIDLNRLRAALRLILDGEMADRIVTNTVSVPPERAIKRVSSSVNWEWHLSKIRRRLRRGSQPDVEPPLGPHTGVPARGAITLALHLGLGLPIESIARATSIGAGQLGNDLYQTRLKLEPRLNPACGQFVSAIGRYRDGSLDIAARATLIQHAQHCPACRNALDRFQALDSRLLDQIEQERATLPPLSEQSAPNRVERLRKPLALVAAFVLAIAVLGAGGYAFATGRGHDAERPTSGPTLSGWILTSDVGGNVVALNLASGQQRPLDARTQPGQPGYFPSSTALSPNSKLIANQVASTGQTQYQELIIETTSAKQINRIQLTNSFMRFAGWLGNSTVLEISYPPQESGESADDYFTRAQTHALLTGVDITTGDEQVLFTGAVTEVFPSPDGTLIAIISTSVQSNSGLRRMELRRVDDGRVSETVTTVTDRVASVPMVSFTGLTSSGLIWAPDSSRIFMATTNAPVAEAPTPDIFASPTPAPLAPTQIVSIARDGTIHPIPEPTDATTNVPITVSPDGNQLIVQSMMLSATAYHYRLSKLTLSTDVYHPLTGWSLNALSSPVWSPDGSTLLGLEWQPFLASPTDKPMYSTAQVAGLVALPNNGDPFAVMTRMAGDIGTNFLGWLPETALSEPPSPPMPVRLSQPGSVKLSQANLRIDTTAQVSGNGDYIILHDSVEKKSIIWDRANTDGRDLPAGTHDLSWFPNTPAVVGVANAQIGDANTPSRLTTFAPTFSVSLPSYDYRLYDPAQIGSSLTEQYAAPRMSPNENALAFFVLDTRDHSVALWLTDYDAAVTPVAHWSLPNDNKLSYVPIAGWIDNQTLLFAVPGGWHDGLPGEVRLNRLTVRSDGSALIDTAATLQRHGTERGIAIDELAINQASGRIAYRLRHFTKNSTNDGIIDTLAIASEDKLSDALEISRGGSSSGLSWSPDGRLLAATTPDALEFYSASGNALFGVSGLDFPNEPRWIDQNTVWFNESNDQGTRIMSVDLQ